MARKIAAAAPSKVSAEQVLKALEEFESTPDNPTTTQEIAGEFSIADADAFAILNALADAGKIDSGDGTKIPRGSWFILSEPVAPVPAPKPAPTPAKRAAARKAAAQKPIAAPVEPAESQTGLTRAQVAKELPTVVLETPKAEPKDETPAAWWDAPEHEPTIPEFKGPDNIPAPPEGVSPNFWYMAFYANTAPARKFWADKVDAQLKTWDAEQTAKRVQDNDAPPF